MPSFSDLKCVSATQTSEEESFLMKSYSLAMQNGCRLLKKENHYFPGTNEIMDVGEDAGAADTIN